MADKPHLWTAGKSGNPTGRPKQDPELKALAKAYTQEAVARLGHWLKSDNAKASVMAAQVLLDRGYGKAPQEIDLLVKYDKLEDAELDAQIALLVANDVEHTSH